MIKDIILQVGKAACAAVVFTLLYTLIFAGIITLFGVPTSAIRITNQVFKVLSIAFGGLLFLRGERGLFKGVALGLSAVIQEWLLFSTIACSFDFGWTLLLELVIGAFAGGIVGIIADNVKKA